jgi:hypothetical protein
MSDNWVLCDHDIPLPEPADGDDGLHTYKVSPNVFSHSWITEKRWSSNLGVGGEHITSNLEERT